MELSERQLASWSVQSMIGDALVFASLLSTGFLSQSFVGWSLSDNSKNMFWKIKK